MLTSLPTTLGPESRRLLHGRGGHFPGLEHVAIDWFAPVLLLTLYVEKETNSDLISELTAFAKTNPEVTTLVVQERHLPKGPKGTLYGELPSQPIATETGLHYHLSLDRNQNHGFFLDMKPGRDWIRAHASGKRVLNLFAYTCSLSVAALAGGADSVVNLDMASGALATGRKNHHLNFDPATCQRASYLPHDLFKSWGRLVRGAPYDLVVIDPPSNQGKSFKAENHYPKILRRLPELLTDESQILACLNAPHLDESFLTDLFADYQPHGRLPCAPGFEDQNPSAALKCLLFTG
ncbi:MAG: class I SAM-dependent methyltransferase [Verrucomicrobiaceae bacterium]